MTSSDQRSLKPLYWRKKGLILDPEQAPQWRRAHSGMVSLLPDENGYRLYVTGRDEARQFQIGSATLDKNFKVIGERPDNPILTKGRMGCFDCNGLCLPMVVRISDSVLYMYYAGWGLAPRGLFENRPGLAISRDDGATWQKWSEAPLALIDDKDPITVGSVFVLREADDYWRMWYTSFQEWRPVGEGEYLHYYRIKYAESSNGIHWRKPEDNIAIDFANESEFAVARPMVLKENGGYRMWFSTCSVGEKYRIGYAESLDGVSWQRRDSNIGPSPEGWDSEMVEYSFVVKDGDKYFMLYNGNKWGGSGTGLAVANA
jgi:hypothetical protein